MEAEPQDHHDLRGGRQVVMRVEPKKDGEAPGGSALGGGGPSSRHVRPLPLWEALLSSDPCLPGLW